MAKYNFWTAPCNSSRWRLVMSTTGKEIADYHKKDIQRGGHAGKRWKMFEDSKIVWRFNGSCQRR